MVANWLPVLLAAVAAVVANGFAEDRGVDPTEATSAAAVCQPPPYWTVDGENLMAKHRGNVTVVVLLQASWPICLWQASGFESLYNRYLEAGLWELSVVIINSGQPHSIQLRKELEKRVETIPVYQETDEEPVWSILNGDKDDVFIYDRCGRLSYYIPLPLSFLNRPYVGAAILNAYFNDPCGVCDNSTLHDYDERVNNISIASEVLETNETVLFSQDQTDQINRNTSRTPDNATRVGDDNVGRHGSHRAHRHRHQHGLHGHRNGSASHHNHHHHAHDAIPHGNHSDAATEGMQDSTLRLHGHQQHGRHHAQHDRKKHEHHTHGADAANENPPTEQLVDVNKTEATEVTWQQPLLTSTDVTVPDNVTLPERRSSRRRNGRRNREHDHSGRRGRERNRTSENAESRPRRHFFHSPCSSVKDKECKMGRSFSLIGQCCYLLPNNRISSRPSNPGCESVTDIKCAKLYRLRECCRSMNQKQIKPRPQRFPLPVSCEGFDQVTCRLTQRLGFIHNECCPSYLYQPLVTGLIMPKEVMCRHIDDEQCQRYQKNGLTHLCCSADHQTEAESSTNWLQSLKESCWSTEIERDSYCNGTLGQWCNCADDECLINVRTVCRHMAQSRKWYAALESLLVNGTYTANVELPSVVKTAWQNAENGRNSVRSWWRESNDDLWRQVRQLGWCLGNGQTELWRALVTSWWPSAASRQAERWDWSKAPDNLWDR